MLTLVLYRRQHLEPAIEPHHPAGGAQLIVAGFDRDRRYIVYGGRHLACYESAPDQLVKANLIAFEAGQVRGHHGDIRRPDSFMRLLSRSLALVNVGLIGQIRRTVCFLNKGPCFSHGVAAEVGGISAHIGDVPRLVQPLRQSHRFSEAIAKPAAGGLLKRRRYQGGRRLFGSRFVFPLAYRVFFIFELRLRDLGFTPTGRLERFFLVPGDLRLKTFFAFGPEIG